MEFRFKAWLPIFNAEMNLYSRGVFHGRKSVHVLQKRSAGVGREARVPVECGDTRSSGTEGEEGVGHARGPKHIERISTTLPISQGRRPNAFGIAPAPSNPHPSPPRRPSIHPLSRLDVVSRRAASSPFAPLSRALSPYQIESLYFASSIISFINLRAFRTL